MKKLTPQEMMLLETLETHAARMSGIQAMLEILSDWGPFTDDSLSEEARAGGVCRRC